MLPVSVSLSCSRASAHPQVSRLSSPRNVRAGGGWRDAPPHPNLSGDRLPGWELALCRYLDRAGGGERQAEKHGMYSMEGERMNESEREQKSVRVRAWEENKARKRNQMRKKKAQSGVKA